MSFGFGFALPAYPLRGGGGNNPFNQLGATLDLSFVGTAGDLSGAGTYTLNTDFIIPQYQIAAQYVVWETGVGLVDKTFSQIVTFSRTSGATWFNSAGANVGIDFSTSSVTIGTGSKTFTLTATAGIDRSWAAGDIVRISEQATPANFMDGTVTSYTASTQTLVVNVTATGGSGTIASWRVSNWMPRFDYDPITLAAQGLLIEESRTNSIRNNTMQGAVAGTPGTAPTNWTFSTTGATTTQVFGTGTENGITYIDIRFQGTGAADSWNLIYDSSIVAANGQTWTSSVYLKLVAGAITNLPLIQRLVFRNSSFVNIQSLDSSAITPTGAGLATQRSTLSLTATQATTAFVTNQLNSGTPTGAYDITLRIGLPQLEQGAFATSVIPTTVAAATRNADQASVNTLSPWFNASAGTLFVQALRGDDVDATIATFAIGSTTADRIQIHSSTSSEYRATYRTGNVEQAALLLSSSTNSPKIAATIKTNDLAASINGALPQTATPASIAAYDTLWIGRRSDANIYWNGHIQRLTYYPRRLSNAELQAITA